MTIITNSVKSPTGHLDWDSNEIGKLVTWLLVGICLVYDGLQVQNLLEGDNVDPRSLIECLLDEIIQLKKELTLGFLETVQGAAENIQHGVQEDGLDGQHNIA